MKTPLCTIAIFLALHGAPAQPVLTTFEKPDSTFFPISLGNEWTFTSHGAPRTERISDTATINGRLYYGLSIWPPYISYWLRTDNDSVFLIRAGNDTTEHLLFDFNASVGDTITLPTAFGCDWGVRIVLLGREETVSTPAGTFTHSVHFRHINQCNDAGMLESWFARGVGRVKYVEVNYVGWITYELAGFNLTTGIETPPVATEAGEFALVECYPNPFNAHTTVRFRLAGASSVSLDIVDLLGRHVARLVRGQMPPGDHQAVLDAGDLPSGVYFVVLRADQRILTRKLVLQK